jgi:hypothetical protein
MTHTVIRGGQGEDHAKDRVTRTARPDAVRDGGHASTREHTRTAEGAGGGCANATGGRGGDGFGSAEFGLKSDWCGAGAGRGAEHRGRERHDL